MCTPTHHSAIPVSNKCNPTASLLCHLFIIRTVASRTEGYQAGDLVTVMDRAISHSELRILCPTHFNPFGGAQESLCRPFSIESGSDMDSSVELSSSPQKPHYLTNFQELTLPQLQQETDSGNVSSSSRSNAVYIHKKKKISVISASSLTPGTPSTPTSFERLYPSPPPHRNPLCKSGSLSQMNLSLQDFETALKGFVPLSLRGLPLHTSGTVDFLQVGGMEPIKLALKETLQWPIKVMQREG